jgi:hypothetical protein
VRGAVSVIVDGVDGAQEVSGASVATWSERFVAGAARVTIAAGATGRTPSCRFVPASRAPIWSSSPSAAWPSRRPRPLLADDPAVADAGAAPEVVPVDAEEPPAADLAARGRGILTVSCGRRASVGRLRGRSTSRRRPSAPPSPPLVAPELPAPPPAPTTGPIAGVGDTLGPAMTTALPEAPEEHEMIWGETIARPPVPAPSAQTPSAPEAQPAARGGDHDGATISVAEARALRDAERAQFESTDGVPPRRPRGAHPPVDGRGRRTRASRRDRAPSEVHAHLRRGPADAGRGRQPQQDISRSHVEIRAEGDHVLVTDLDTTNGTLLPAAARPGAPAPERADDGRDG